MIKQLIAYASKLVLFVGIFIYASSYAQVYKPVKWNFSSTSIENGNIELVFKASIEKGWHLYAQKVYADGPIPTSFLFDSTTISNYQKIDSVKEITPAIKHYDKQWEAEIEYFENEAVFKQTIHAISSKPFELKGVLEFMVCNDSMCLPPEQVDFSFTITPEKKNELLDVSSSSGNGKSTWVIFILGFLSGLAALLTPCVFPMIPLTVSFFTKQGGKSKGLRKAILYGVSIVLIYVALGFLITLLLGPDALNALSSNEWMNLLFFIIFLIFGISFLGAFEITLPSSWINKADKASDKGGLMGIFFMAFTLSLVSFSCTGPIIGSLLVEAAVGGNYIGPVIGMTGFALALALPFTLFAAFPGWLNSLPKSGGWLNSVKVVLGLLEIAFSLKFLSVVDLAGFHIETIDFHINGPVGILKREVFLALWIVIFSILGFYFLGKIKFPHDSNGDGRVSIPRLLLAIVTFAFVVYLIPGMWGAPVKLISGFPPPSFHSEGWSITSASNSSIKQVGESTHKAGGQCPHNLNCFHDYDEALAEAKKQNKPLMIDFTGWACVNCRKMEENVWIDPRVLQRLNEDYILVSLYVDDKTALPESQQYTSETTGKKIKTIGNKWSDLQTKKYKTNSQPWYVLLDHEEQQLNQARGYNPDIEAYIEFLDKGKEQFFQNSKK